MSVHAEPSGIVHNSKIIVFINPTAGAGRARKYLPLIERVFESFRSHAQFVITRSAEELESCAQEAILQGRNLLFTVGGDGTLQALANATFGANVILGIVP